MTVLKRKYALLPYFLMQLKIQVFQGKTFCLRSEGEKKACFFKSWKINRLSPHLQALWECDLKCCWGSESCLKESSRARRRPGISSLDTVSPSPDDRPASQSGYECPGDETLRERVRRQGNKGTAGGSSSDRARLWGCTAGGQEK